MIGYLCLCASTLVSSLFNRLKESCGMDDPTFLLWCVVTGGSPRWRQGIDIALHPTPIIMINMDYSQQFHDSRRHVYIAASQPFELSACYRRNHDYLMSKAVNVLLHCRLAGCCRALFFDALTFVHIQNCIGDSYQINRNTGEVGVMVRTVSKSQTFIAYSQRLLPVG